MGNSSYVETLAQEITLNSPEIPVEASERLVQWLYTKNYALSPIIQENTQDRYMDLAALFVLAEIYVIADLKNSVVDKLFELQAKRFQPALIPIVEYVYKNTPVSSPFRYLLAAYYAWEIGMDWYTNANTHNHLRSDPEFAADVAIHMGKRLSWAHRSPFDGLASDLYTTNNTSNSPSVWQNETEEGAVEPRTITRAKLAWSARQRKRKEMEGEDTDAVKRDRFRARMRKIGMLDPEDHL